MRILFAVPVGMSPQLRATGGTGYGSATYMRVTELEVGHENSLYFDFYDAGLIEIIPYRVWTADAGIDYKIGMTALQPLTIMMTAFMGIVRYPSLAIHDTLKIVMIPGAAVYYAQQDSPAPAAPAAEGN